MERATTDRGSIIHLAGFQGLSPALDGGARPALSAAAGAGLTRCGWEPFFAAMRAHRLALELDPGGGAPRFVPAGQARTGREPRRGLSHALEHSRRFWRALFP